MFNTILHLETLPPDQALELDASTAALDRSRPRFRIVDATNPTTKFRLAFVG